MYYNGKEFFNIYSNGSKRVKVMGNVFSFYDSGKLIKEYANSGSDYDDVTTVNDDDGNIVEIPVYHRRFIDDILSEVYSYLSEGRDD